jgi:hypothetical protein
MTNNALFFKHLDCIKVSVFIGMELAEFELTNLDVVFTSLRDRNYD